MVRVGQHRIRMSSCSALSERTPLSTRCQNTSFALGRTMPVAGTLRHVRNGSLAVAQRSNVLGPLWVRKGQPRRPRRQRAQTAQRWRDMSQQRNGTITALIQRAVAAELARLEHERRQGD